MAPTLSKLITKKNAAGAVSVAVLIWLLRTRKKHNSDNNPVVSVMNMLNMNKTPKKAKAQVDAVFFRQLRRLLSILIPGPFSAEMGYFVLIALSLVSRSLCDLWLIHTATYIET
ncbi:ATP-binding cassette sub-family D member 3 [Blattella germanica]|nr:ATP-binding cassette sub-family D member 3 [Blattella germanica]